MERDLECFGVILCFFPIIKTTGAASARRSAELPTGPKFTLRAARRWAMFGPFGGAFRLKNL